MRAGLGIKGKIFTGGDSHTREILFPRTLLTVFGCSAKRQPCPFTTPGLY